MDLTIDQKVTPHSKSFVLQIYNFLKQKPEKIWLVAIDENCSEIRDKS